MSRIEDVLVPPNAEGTRATVLRWCKAVGNTVIKDEPLVELETDKVTVEVPAPVSGTLIEVLKSVDTEVSPDEVLARLRIDTSRATPEIEGPPPASAAGDSQEPLSPPLLSPPLLSPPPLSPSVRRLLREHSIAAGHINGTGRNGRVTAQDVTRHVSRTQVPRASLPKTVPESAPESAREAADTLVPHSAIRRRVAEHMVRSLADAPHVTTLFEADLTRVLKHRSLHAQSYESRGTRLTLTVYFISACVRALRAHPEVNATFGKDAMQLHGDVNVGVGTALGHQGLIVPVIHRAQALSLFDIARRLNELVAGARAGRLAPQDVRGGTFTISNHGVGGSLLAAPIVINQPQVAILGVGKVQRRVCVIEAGGSESIAVRPMCYLTLTIDHRALDAFQANAFLKLVVETLEQWPDTAEPLHD
jgi:2-oxoglutarate dehydrogenase E2 component (dihydrolipoamide succinyltransferase)